MEEVLKDLNVKKAKQENDIPIKLNKENIELFSFVLSRMFNFYIDKTSFPNSLKQAYITPVHKKDETNDKNNYRPVTILPSLSKALKSACIINFMLTLIVFFLRPNAVLEKATVLSIQLLQ